MILVNIWLLVGPSYISNNNLLAFLDSISLDNASPLRKCPDGTSLLVRHSQHPNLWERNPEESPTYIFLRTHYTPKLYMTLEVHLLSLCSFPLYGFLELLWTTLIKHFQASFSWLFSFFLQSFYPLIVLVFVGLQIFPGFILMLPRKSKIV